MYGSYESRPEPPSYVDGTYGETDVMTDAVRLRVARRSRVFPLTAAIVGLYLLNALLANVAGDLMAVTLVGHLNIGLGLALLQFATTVAVCRWYSRYADTTLDPLVANVRAGLQWRGQER